MSVKHWSCLPFPLLDECLRGPFFSPFVLSLLLSFLSFCPFFFFSTPFLFWFFLVLVFSFFLLFFAFLVCFFFAFDFFFPPLRFGFFLSFSDRTTFLAFFLFISFLDLLTHSLSPLSHLAAPLTSLCRERLGSLEAASLISSGSAEEIC